jgi:hypothetical protein
VQTDKGYEKMKIMILDNDLDRMNRCEDNIRQALKSLQLKAEITKVCEPPYLARMDVLGRLPALDVDGDIWSRPSRNAFNVPELLTLLRRVGRGDTG